MAGATASSSVSGRGRAKLVEQTWIWSVVGYTVLRFVIAWGAFSEHGANVWIFGLLDVGTAWPYAKAVAVVCRRSAAGQWRRLPVPIMVALASFFAPYAYLWFAAGSMPDGLRLGLAIAVSALAIAAVGGIVLRVRKLRSDEPAVAADATDGVPLAEIDLRASDRNDDIVIDLRSGEARIERRSAAPDVATGQTRGSLDEAP